MAKTRFEIAPELEDFGNKYIKNIDEKAILMGAKFMDGLRNEVRLFWVIPATKTEKEKWGCGLVDYNE